MIQLDLFAPPPAPPIATPLRQRREVQTRAAQHGGIIAVYSDDDPQPFEMTVRGIPCVISWSGGGAGAGDGGLSRVAREPATRHISGHCEPAVLDQLRALRRNVEPMGRIVGRVYDV